MDKGQFETLVAQLEVFARTNPKAYKRRVVGLAVLGDLYLWGLLLLLAASIGAAAYFLFELKWIAVKLIVVLVPIAAMLARALWVTLPSPEGIRVSRNDATALFEMIESVRAEIDAPPFHHVLVDADFNASVVQVPRLGAFGWSKNYLILGLPLMKALTPEQFKAVLAHEYGHLAGGHAALSNWIYRQRLRWSRLQQSLEERGGNGGILFMGFLKRYAPYLNAYSFPLARANEYEADMVAAKVTSPRAMAQALTAVNVGGTYLAESFWPGLYKQANHFAAPSVTPYTSLSTQIEVDSRTIPREEWIGRALGLKTTTADTHPCLADRLKAIGGEALLALPESSRAADQLLGGSLADVTKRLDDQWTNRVADSWRVRFQQASSEREQLASLDGKLAAGELLSFEESFSRALLLDSSRDDLAACITALRELHGQQPSALKVSLALGSRLLYMEDASGIAILETVIASDQEYALPCTEAIYRFHERNGNHDEATAVAKRIGEKSDEQRLADAERSAVLPTDAFIEHGIDESTLAELKRQISQISELDAVYFVQKACAHLPTQKSYVTGFTVKGKWPSGREKKTTAALVGFRTHVTFPGHTMIISLEGANSAYLKRLRSVANARLQ